MDFSYLRSRPDGAVLALILAFLVFRLILAAMLGFTVDESYTIANARDLSLSYFDHPPLHYWIAHAFMPILGEGHAARLPFILLFSVSSWLLYDAPTFQRGGGDMGRTVDQSLCFLRGFGWGLDRPRRAASVLPTRRRARRRAKPISVR